LTSLIGAEYRFVKIDTGRRSTMGMDWTKSRIGACLLVIGSLFLLMPMGIGCKSKKQIQCPKGEGRLPCLQKHCNKEHASICKDLALMKIALKKFSEAQKPLETACEGGNLEGCYYLAWYYESGTGVFRDEKKAKPLYLKACEGGIGKSCAELGLMLLREEDDEAAKQAHKYLTKGCSADVAKACSGLGYLLLNGKGVEKSPSKAQKMMVKGCHGGFGRGCTEIGRMYAYAVGVERDDSIAISWYKKGCNAQNEDASGCYQAGLTLVRSGKPEERAEAKELFTRACKMGEKEACSLAPP